MNRKQAPLLALGATLIVSGCDALGGDVREGNALAAEGQWAAARAAFVRAAEARPGEPRALALLGQALLREGRRAEARARFEAAAAQGGPDAFSARVGLARLALLGGERDAALRALDSLVEERPENPSALAARAAVLLARAGPGDLPRALEDATAADARSEGRHPYLLACALLAAGKTDEAAKTLQVLAARSPTSPHPWYGLARVAAARGDRAQVQSNLRKARSAFGEAWPEDAVRNDPAFAAWANEEIPPWALTP